MKRTALFLYLVAAILSLTACAKSGEKSLRTDDDGFDDYDLPEIVVGGICEHCLGGGKCISCQGSGECGCNNGKCSNCKGSGKCSRCGGTGKKDCWRCNGTGEMNCSCTRGNCPTCHGSGKILDDFNHSHTCSACNGTGKHKKCKGTGKVECTSCNGKGYQNCDLCSAGSGHCISCSGSGQCKSCDGSLVCRYCGGKGICAYCGGNGHVEGAEDHLLIPLLCGEHRKEWFGDKSNNPQAGSLVFSKYGRAYRLDDSGTVCSACFWTGGYRKSDDGIIIYIVNMDDASIVDPSLNPTPASFEIAGISSTSMEMSVSGSEKLLYFLTTSGSASSDSEEPFVDLGVKNAEGKPLYWAKCNLGASKPEDYGYYYFWAGTTGYIHDGSKWVNAKTSEDLSGGFCDTNTPYCVAFSYTKYIVSDSKTVLEPEDDAATKANSSWRTPTIDEFAALLGNCVCICCDGTIEKYKGTTVAGYIVYKAKNDGDKGKVRIIRPSGEIIWGKWDGSSYIDGSAATGTYSASDTHIFFPAAGRGSETTLDRTGSLGSYWSSSNWTIADVLVFVFEFGYDNIGEINPYTGGGARPFGLPVRPVSD